MNDRPPGAGDKAASQARIDALTERCLELLDSLAAARSKLDAAIADRDLVAERCAGLHEELRGRIEPTALAAHVRLLDEALRQMHVVDPGTTVEAVAELHTRLLREVETGVPGEQLADLTGWMVRRTALENQIKAGLISDVRDTRQHCAQVEAARRELQQATGEQAKEMGLRLDLIRQRDETIQALSVRVEQAVRAHAEVDHAQQVAQEHIHRLSAELSLARSQADEVLAQRDARISELERQLEDARQQVQAMSQQVQAMSQQVQAMSQQAQAMNQQAQESRLLGSKRDGILLRLLLEVQKRRLSWRGRNLLPQERQIIDELAGHDDDR